MVQFRAWLLWCCGTRHDSEDLVDQELSFPGEKRSSAAPGQGVSGMQGSDTSMDQVVQQSKDLSTAPKLNLVPIESPALQAGKVLHINAYGLEGSLRGKRDGMTYIGSEAGGGRNDFAIPLDASLGAQHLVIKYNPSTSKYYLKDLGDGSGTFARIDIPILLKHGYIISFGESHMVVNLAGENARPSLTVKFLDGPKADQSFRYSPGDKPVLIGRMADCNIKFDDNSLSRYQCSLLFVEDKGWFATDGDGKKCSTNGTWLFVDELFEIFNNMVFKAGQTLFQAQYEDT